MTEPKKPPTCAICGKAQQEQFKPFCSRRCADVDLHRWMVGAYAIPAEEHDDEADSMADMSPESSGPSGKTGRN